MVGKHTYYQNLYFNEYINNTSIDVLKEHNNKWLYGDTCIYKIPLKEQASYADYVTTKVCLLDEDIIVDFALELLEMTDMIIKNKDMINSCAIGNTAHVICTLDKFPKRAMLRNVCYNLLTELIKIRYKI